MEVHHHPNVEKKNFKEYFLELKKSFDERLTVNKQITRIPILVSTVHNQRGYPPFTIRYN